MENHLFLLELFVETISFSSNLPEYPLLQDVKVTASMGDYVNIEIVSLQTPSGMNEPQKDVTFNSGMSSLFAGTQEELLQNMNKDTFTINVFVKQKLVSSAPIGLPKDFYTLVKQCHETQGVIGPVSIQDQFLLQEAGGERIIGDIKAAVRLSSFGACIKTSFQLIKTEQGVHKKFLVKGARGETTFECQKLNAGNSAELLPLTTLFTDVESPPASICPVEDDRVSWMALFKSAMDPRVSVTPEEFNVAISTLFDRKTASNITFDIISIMDRPEENKYVDLRIKGGSHGFIFEFDMPKQDGSQKTDFSSLQEEELTVEKINKMLCKNKDCPAVRKFKEMGIGPFAIHKGLGTVYGEPSLPVTYGLTQTYGVFDEYGPYGLFSRPKTPSQPFIPKQQSNWQSSCWKPKKRKDKECVCCCQKYNYGACHCKPQKSPLRLNGGSVGESVSFSQEYNQKINKHHQVLRLNGGGVLDYDDVKSPFHECKEIMDQFDEVLRKYKKALGPCGHVTCPFAPNVTKESCKKMCTHGMDVYSASNIVPQETETEKTCPLPSPSTKFKPKGACGSAKCAYAKYKHGLMDQDVDIEIATLPPAKRSCGHPKCPVEPELPPIHWDCPDPLPKGKCKNPNCPYLPKEIKCLNAVLGKGVCGNFNCPFAPPDPCKSPYCPFQPRQCPYESDSDSYCTDEECLFPSKRKDNVGSQNHPAASQQYGDNRCPPVSCWNPLLAYYALATGDQNLLQICFGGPECPYNMQQDVCPPPPPCPQGGGKSKKSADDSTCARKMVKKTPSPCYPPMESKCGNPNCPYAKKAEVLKQHGGAGEGKEGDIEYTSDTRLSVDLAPCHPGTCKYQKGSNLTCEACCPEKIKVNDLCQNPNCPFAPASATCYIKPPPCYEQPENDDVCGNPDCPFSPKPSCGGPPCGSLICPGSVPPCGSPVCPGNAPPCGSPICPGSVSPCASPVCPGGIPPCGSPVCPGVPANDCTPNPPCFNPCSMAFPPCPFGIDPVSALLALGMPISLCPDGICPFPTKDTFQICYGGPTCPFTKPPVCTPEPCTTEVQSVKDDEVCDNAECPYAARRGADVTSQRSKPTENDVGADVNVGETAVVDEGTEYITETRVEVDLAPCTKKTCQSQGGTLICEECPCMKGEKGGISKTKATEKKNKSKISTTKTKKTKKKGKFVYSIGDKYTGVQVGHKECVMPAFNVPPKMGWLWNIWTPCNRLKPRRGWRPGAIARSIAETIRKHRAAQGLPMLEVNRFRTGKKDYDRTESATSVNVKPKATLQIKKHDGCYWITMNPLKDPHTLVENENPYMECTPLQFKISKNKDKKAEEENEEYKSCFCEGDKELSSSDSELEIEFTPPAGIIHPERFKKKRNVVHTDTQYMASDLKSEKESKKGKKEKKDKKGKGKKGKGKKGKKGKKK
ncbi:uncharacterized protein LOC135134430 [Zophobas morio]|uniref:uncharacterized protein LOC135134430 n=1 Tax=Zophobas morio TaxID=2755281 RepID=UPI003083E71D